jgi:hypothetical protein
MCSWGTLTIFHSVTYESANLGAAEAPGPTNDDEHDKGKQTIASFLDKQLENEFRQEELASQTKVDLNETLSREKVQQSRQLLLEHSVALIFRLNISVSMLDLAESVDSLFE